MTIAVYRDVNHQNKQKTSLFVLNYTLLKYNFTGLISIKVQIRKTISALKAHLL